MNSAHAILKDLISQGLVTEDQAIQANTESERSSNDLGKRKSALDILLSKGEVTEANILETTSRVYNTPLISDPLAIDPDAKALEKMTEEQAHRLDAIPLSYDMNIDTLEIAIESRRVGDLNYQDDVRRVTGVRNIKFNIISLTDLAKAWKRVYRAEVSIGRITKDLQTESEKKKALALEEAKSKTPVEVDDESAVQRLVTMILHQAISDGASDIHMEPTERSLIMRQRVDGVLRELQMDIPNSLVNRISSVVKIMARIDLSRKQETHDGRITISDKKSGKEIDIRVSVLPSIYGESIVMRLSDNTLAAVELEQLGFSQRNYDRFMKAMEKPYGMILVTGPTGAGKSTTLYAALNRIATPEKKIITVEDPVEYRIDGITQIEVHPERAGSVNKLDFPNVLRSILRHDPDVILVGEIRDLDTAQISMDAAMTGHLVLTTLHTNSAASAVTRLKEMGIEPYLVGGVAEGVLAQRLIRRLCSKCKQAYTPTSAELISVGYWTEDKGVSPELFRANPGGCRECGQSGYRGRVAVHEVLLINDKIEEMIVSGASTAEIEHAAQQDGMHTLKEDGWEKVASGTTSIEEILRVIS